MNHDQNFTLTCYCKTPLAGIFGDGDYTEVLHCDCGQVWIIPKPHKEEPANADA